MSKYMDLLRERVKTLLSHQGISQNVLGQRIGVSSAEISNWLTAKTAIRFERVCEIAQALGVEPWELLKSEDAQPTPPNPSRFEVLGDLIFRLSTLDENKLRQVRSLLRPYFDGDTIQKQAQLTQKQG